MRGTPASGPSSDYGLETVTAELAAWWSVTFGRADRSHTSGDQETERGFELVWLSEPGVKFGVGGHRFAGQPQPPGQRHPGRAGRQS
jgi:hypothetical protein